MKLFKIKTAILALTLGAVSFTGCKKFLDINDSPNAPKDAQVKLLLPSAQAAIGHVLGNPFQIFGGILGQYWTQGYSSSQYKTIDQYSQTASTFDRPWRIIYSDGLQDLQMIIQKGEGKEEEKQYAAIAYIMKAYNLQLATDAFGDVPGAEAGKSEQFLNPHYDTQEVVYDSIIVFINKGMALIDVNAAVVPGSEDLIFQGDMEKWQRFANTLKLRAYLRISKVAAGKAEAGVKSLQGAKFLEEDAKIQYTTIGGNQNPLFAEILGLGRTQNLVASATAVDEFNANNDPRAAIFYEKEATLGKVVGIPQGAFDTISGTPPFSIPSTIVGGKGLDDQSGLAPVKFISGAESYLLQSEAASKGWLSGNAKQLMESGIVASFKSYGIEAAASNYISTAADAKWPADKTKELETIIRQKYYAMCGNQCFEAWTEWRRTGYPSFFVESVASALGAGQMPQRLLYPSSEINQNSNFPGAKTVTDPMWWQNK